MVLWDRVCQLKSKGGLGVIDLRFQNNALLMKNLHQIYNRHTVRLVSLIWSTYYNGKVPHALSLKGSFWWRDVLQFVDNFRGLSKCAAGDGGT